MSKYIYIFTVRKNGTAPQIKKGIESAKKFALEHQNYWLEVFDADMNKIDSAKAKDFFQKEPKQKTVKQ